MPVCFVKFPVCKLYLKRHQNNTPVLFFSCFFVVVFFTEDPVGVSSGIQGPRDTVLTVVEMLVE